jgi:hypothetical protein
LKRNIKAEVREKQRASAAPNEKQKNHKEVKGNARKYNRSKRHDNNAACNAARHTREDVVVDKPRTLQFVLQQL